MLKTLAFLGVIFGIIWFFFIRKPNKSSTPKPQEETMVECAKCQTFISQNEAILSNGRYYCCNECLLKG